MGNAFTGVADDASSMYYNPAGLSQIQGTVFGGMYSYMMFDRQHYYGSLVYGSKRFGTIGVMGQGFAVTGIEQRNMLGYKTGTFNDYENAFSLGYALRVFPAIGIGGSVKYINHVLSHYSAHGYAFDAGIHTTIPIHFLTIERIRIGIAAKNLAGIIRWNTGSGNMDHIPMTGHIGAAIDMRLGFLKIIYAGDMMLNSTHQIQVENIQFSGGTELWLYDVLGIRGGIKNIEINTIGINSINFGCSLRVSPLVVEYAYNTDVLSITGMHKFGFQFRF
ncbi:MAG: PorV/PorQ family protein [Candidatus Marinimicrobia bacterium]|nr:PorV/PorQ family protein [Candidatus Neomarinimicrobiota bacterium]MCF7880206.1 PorV/PorQ family protein [Candidatus Neomarinimicrobiota bacterium]